MSFENALEKRQLFVCFDFCTIAVLTGNGGRAGKRSLFVQL